MAATIGRPFIINLGALSFTSFIRTIILISLGAEILKLNYQIISTSKLNTHIRNLYAVCK